MLELCTVWYHALHTLGHCLYSLVGIRFQTKWTRFLTTTSAMDSSDETIQRESLLTSPVIRMKKVVSIYSEKSSVSGVSFITGTKYKLVRLIWSLLLFIAIVCMCVHLAKLISKYLSFRKQSVIDLNFSMLPFPAVTICNVNPIRRSMVKLSSPKLTALINGWDPTRLRGMENEAQNTIDTIRSQLDNKLHGQPPSIVMSPDLMKNDSLPYLPHQINATSSNGTNPDHNLPPVDKRIKDIFEKQAYNLNEKFDVDKFLNSDWNDDADEADDGGDGSAYGPDFGSGQPDASLLQHEASRFLKIYQAFRILYSAETAEIRKVMGHQLDSLLVSCVFEGKNCRKDINLTYSSVYGNCFTIQFPNIVVAKDGPMSGLDIVLFLEGDEYITGFTPAKGAQIVIHEPGTTPFPADEGFSISAGMHTMVGLKMHDIHRLGSPYGDCTDVDYIKEKYGIVYTRQTCQKVCIARHIIHRCGCFDVASLSLKRILKTELNALPCRSRKDRQCSSVVTRDMSSSNHAGCFCSNPCTEKKFKKTISSRVWPDQGYARLFVNSICSKANSSWKDVITCLKLTNKSGEALREEFLKLTVYYEDLNYEQLHEVPDYELVSLISDIGGTIGLWIGLSLLSICEVVHLLANLGIDLLCPNVKSHCKPLTGRMNDETTDKETENSLKQNNTDDTII